MKTLTFIRSGRYRTSPILVDYDKHTVDTLKPFRSVIDEIYIAPEDIEVKYKQNGKFVVVKAQKGDIVITFYDEDWIKIPVIVVKNTDWKANVIEFIKADEARKAKELVDVEYRNAKCPCGNCDACESC